ncbi:MAG: hypothetical protein HC881_24345 [Leptolyngbyaceae cyanobacterium SL_7_1]|nr:hypothetical protein [Leptolyngbyaceae cyanobacterium SL_7_1]
MTNRLSHPPSTESSLLETIHHQAVANQEWISLLASYQLIPQLLCETIIDRAIATIPYTTEETTQAYKQFYQQWNLTTTAQQQQWRSHCGLNQAQFDVYSTFQVHEVQIV